MNMTKENFALRLQTAMQERGYEPKPAVLEKQFNLHYNGEPMTLHGVRRWLRGETLPSQDKLIALAEWLRIPPDELRYGAEIKAEIQQVRKNWDDAINYQERETFEAFLNLPAQQKKIVREVILAFKLAYPNN
jgi:transcriptional regulator with XRE-family HTH domain